MKDAQKPDHVSLNTLISRLKEGRFVIPDFQREFEWRPWDINSLMRSIFLDYYIGSLLLWKGKKENFEADSAANGTQAWDSMMRKKPDMVLLDVMMSTTLEGVDLSRKMAADSKLKNIPIIMISSIDSSWHAGKLPDNIHIPIDAWISKPVNPEHLLKTIRRFLS